MSGASVPLSRPGGRALVVGGAACRSEPLSILARQGLMCDEADDVYAAMAQVAQRPMVFRALVLSLSSLYREELEIIATIKRRYPHIEVWVSQSDGRQAALAESVRLGADALVSDEGVHKIGTAEEEAARGPLRAPPVAVVQSGPMPDEAADRGPTNDTGLDEPVLTAEELRALLADQTPVLPQSHESREKDD